MSAASATEFPSERPWAYRAVLWGGLLAGVLDITGAFVTHGLRGVSPLRILQSIAGGLLGKASYEGGLGTAALGVMLHFVIAFGAAFVYYAASRRFDFLVRRPVVCGLLYGIAVYLFMNSIVLPLSAFPHKIWPRFDVVLTGLVVHMLCVGLPIALTVRRYSK